MDTIEQIAGKMPKWVRWPLVPVSAVLTAIVVWFIAAILAKIIVFFDGGRGWGENFFLYVLIPGFSTYCSVVAGTVMAPRFRQGTSLLLSIAWAFAAGILTFISILMAVWTNLITVASICIGCGVAAMTQYYAPEDSPIESEILA